MGGKPDLLSRLVGREQVSCVKPPNADSDETNVREHLAAHLQVGLDRGDSNFFLPDGKRGG